MAHCSRCVEHITKITLYESWSNPRGNCSRFTLFCTLILTLTLKILGFLVQTEVRLEKRLNDLTAPQTAVSSFVLLVVVIGDGRSGGSRRTTTTTIDLITVVQHRGLDGLNRCSRFIFVSFGIPKVFPIESFRVYLLQGCSQARGCLRDHGSSGRDGLSIFPAQIF